MGYIYLRKNLSNGKCYVGQAKDIKDRNRRWNRLNEPYAGKVINNARAKYGTDGFSFEIIKECEDEELNYWEMYYVKEYNSKKPYGYNSTDGGDSIFEMTDEIRKKIGDTLRGRKLSEEHKQRLKGRTPWNKGKKLPHTEEWKKKMQGRTPWNKGKKDIYSEEHKKKLSEAQKGKKLSEEQKQHMSESHINGKCSKTVLQINKDTGEVIREFPSTMEAGRQGFSQGHVAACCRGERKTHKGYIWQFKENAQE